MPQLFNTSVSASVTRRLAEVADCFRHLTEVYLVSPYKFPNQGVGFPEPEINGFSNLDEAEKYFEDKGLDEKDWGIFGPFKTENEVPVKWDKDKKNIQRVTFTVVSKNEKGEIIEEIIELDKESDAFFLNLASFDMFVLPYYTKLYGANYAKELRDFILDQYQQKGSNGSVILALPHRVTRLLVLAPNNYDISPE